jgi:hypothetical protein
MRRFTTVVPVFAPVLAGVLTLAGCANGIAQREAELAPLVGQSEAAVVQRLGVPTRTYETGGEKFLAYNQSRLDFEPGFGPYYGGGFYGRGFYGGGFGYGYDGFPPEVIQRSCETTFELANGAVKSFALRGNSCNYGTL